MLNPIIFWNIRGIIEPTSCCAWILFSLVLTEGASSHKKTAYVDGDIMIVRHARAARTSASEQWRPHMWQDLGAVRYSATGSHAEDHREDQR
ncbi:hypothetical protein RvY_04933-2 [Ramazzottius varieornatus]|uniref:Secreted protein n=1 Tax=Ramazzottius varieornatus TaxID=947166 RepID=A0A1D1V001_RAMVA|nr:hypothetical protein RvY_04933-2 [Ramazzottius varieornatus]